MDWLDELEERLKLYDDDDEWRDIPSLKHAVSMLKKCEATLEVLSDSYRSVLSKPALFLIVKLLEEMKKAPTP